MSVSYILDMEQLAVLACYLEVSGFPGLPGLPVTDKEKAGETLKKLAGLGMVHLQGAEASVDLGLAFILSAMAKPELIARTAENIVCCCTKGLGVVICPDAYAKNRYRITPLPNAGEAAERVWKSVGKASDSHDFSLWSPDSGWKQSIMTKASLETLIKTVYTEGSKQ